MAAEPTVIELPLADLAGPGPLRERFLQIHQRDWIDAGVARWLDLLQPDGPWPVVVIGALLDATLTGALVGVWSPAPVTRFDDFFERDGLAGHRGSYRALGGVWHFVAVTADSQRPELKLGSPLLDAGIAFVAAQPGAPQCRTLSPVVGLADALAALPEVGRTQRAVWRILRRLARLDGTPWLPILRVHPPRGAVLEAVLWNSRRDETRSANVTLRFAYDLDAKVRAFRAAGYRRWVAARKRLIDGGKAIPAPLPGTFWLPDCGDGAVFSEVAQGIAHELG